MTLSASRYNIVTKLSWSNMKVIRLKNTKKWLKIIKYLQPFFKLKTVNCNLIQV